MAGRRNPEQRAGAREADLAAVQDRLTRAVEALVSGQDWIRALRFAARFRTRSFANTLLIWAQHTAAYQAGLVDAPEPSYVAGYGQWQLLGRHIVAGQHGYVIRAPSTVHEASATPGDPDSWRRLRRGERPRAGETQRHRTTGFVPVRVFDPLSRDCPTRSVVHRIGECALDCLRSTGLAEERDWQAGGFAGSSPAPAFDPVEGQRRCLAVAYVQVQIGVAEFAGTGFRYVPGSTTRPAAPGRLGRAKLGAGEHPTDQFENGALVADDPGRPWTTLDDHTFVPASLIRHTQLCPLPTSTPALPRGPCRWCISCSSALVSTSWPEGLAADRSVNSDRTAHLNQPPRRPARPGGQSARGDQHSAIPRPPGQPNGLRNAVHLMDAAGVRLPVRARAT